MHSVLEQIAVRTSEFGLDAVLASSPENVAYVMGYMIPSQARPKRTRPIAAIVTGSGRSACVLPTPEVIEAKAQSNIKDIRVYNEFTDDPMALVGEALSDLGVTHGTVGFEPDLFPQKHYLSLSSRLPKCQFVDALALFENLRMIKTAAELEVLRGVARLVDDSYRETYLQISVGMTEIDVNSILVSSVLRRGAEGVDKFVVGSGYRSAYVNCAPTKKNLERGDVLRIDAFANIRYYRSDIARTVAIGEAGAKQREIWKRLVELQNLVLEMIRPGASTSGIFKAYRAKYEAFGLGRGDAVNFLGHGIGLTIHEPPYINAFSDTLLRENMILCVEPTYFDGEIGIHLEDEVIVTSNGYELVTDGRNKGELLVLT